MIWNMTISGKLQPDIILLPVCHFEKLLLFLQRDAGNEHITVQVSKCITTCHPKLTFRRTGSLKDAASRIAGVLHFPHIN